MDCGRPRFATSDRSQVEFSRNACLQVRRFKNGTPSVHPLRGDELPGASGATAAISRQPLCVLHRAWRAVHGRRRQSACEGHRQARRFALPGSHPHVLRHGCGYALASAGHDTRRMQSWLGHRSIQHTVRYTEFEQRAVQGFLALKARVATVSVARCLLALIATKFCAAVKCRGGPLAEVRRPSARGGFVRAAGHQFEERAA